MRKPGHKQLWLTSSLDDNCQVYTTPQEQRRQGTEPYSGKLKAQNQDNLGRRQTGHRHTTSLNPKVTSTG